MNIEERIQRLETFKELIVSWSSDYAPEVRSTINQEKQWVRREIVEAGCYQTYTIGPPPAVGGLVMRDVDPISAIFNPPYGMSLTGNLIDQIDATIGVLKTDPPKQATESIVQIDDDIQKGYAFIAMAINPADKDLEDVLDSIKEGCRRCGIQAERVDEVQSNERITDRILESIRKAEFVIADLTSARPNVFYEAGYAQGINKTPIYIARAGTNLEFDLKDYPVIFFKNMRELKDGLEERLRAIFDKPA